MRGQLFLRAAASMSPAFPWTIAPAAAEHVGHAAQRNEVTCKGALTFTVEMYSGNLLRPSPAQHAKRDSMFWAEDRGEEELQPCTASHTPFLGGLLGLQGLPDIVLAVCSGPN